MGGLQEQLVRAHPALADALAALVAHACSIAETMVSQPLQQLRTVTAKLMRITLAICRAPGALPPDAPDSERSARRLTARLEGIYHSAAAAADTALVAVIAESSSTADCSVEATAGDAQRSTAHPAECPLGWYVALVLQLDRSAELAPAGRHLALAALPWALRVQAVQHPQLTTVTKDAARLVRLRYCRAEEVAPRLRILATSLEDPSWLVRSAGLHLLQGFWFRCASPPPTKCIRLHGSPTAWAGCVCGAGTSCNWRPTCRNRWWRWRSSGWRMSASSCAPPRPRCSRASSSAPTLPSPPPFGAARWQLQPARSQCHASAVGPAAIPPLQRQAASRNSMRAC